METTVKLTEPMEWCGKTYEELHFDFSKLTGKDDKRIRWELQLKGRICLTPLQDWGYLSILSAIGANVERDVISALPLDNGDFNAVLAQAKKYLRSAKISRDDNMTLLKPVFEDGKEIKELNFDFAKMRGRDILETTDALTRDGIVVVNHATSTEFLAAFGARAAGIEHETVDKITLADHVRLVNHVRDFFLDRASQQKTLQDSSGGNT